MIMDYHQKKTLCATHLVILIESVYKSNKTVIQVLLEECKYTVKEKIIKRYITDDLFDFSSNFNSNDD